MVHLLPLVAARAGTLGRRRASPAAFPWCASGGGRSCCPTWAGVARLPVLGTKHPGAGRACSVAAGAGLPIATFDSGGVEELVREGRCGVVVPYPDVPGLAAAVVELARDPERRMRAGRDGADLVRSQRSSAVVADGVAAWIRGTLSP